MRTIAQQVVGTLLFAQIFCAVAVADEDVRSLRVPLPNQQHNAVKTSWPGIACWFWSAAEFEPEGYKAFVDRYAKYTGVELLTTSIRRPVEVTDREVHDQIKSAAIYAGRHGISLVMDLDVRLARQAFADRYADELQEIVRIREVSLSSDTPTQLEIDAMNLGDHYTFQARGYDCVSSRLFRVYAYSSGEDGINPTTVKDITDRCTVKQADGNGQCVAIPAASGGDRQTACVMAAFTLFTPDVFAPHLLAFERAILDQYADVPLAGACKDEWGFPGRFDPRTDDLWYSEPMAAAYKARRPENDLIRDMLLMAKPERGRERDRAAAINHYMEMCRLRNAEVENHFYDAIKEVFGPHAMSATHPTWYAFPSANEAFKNGLDWWACKRDLAQTDEGTPFCARTALAKKWNSPLWYNMYYDKAIEFYEEDLWRHALGGGRINFHPLWPRTMEDLNVSLLQGDLMRADCRVRLLNYISTAPIDCPVAVIFGHPSALNWSGPHFADVGLSISDELWKAGHYADLIPSSEITEGSLKVADGYIQYGPQRYEAAVLYRPEYERAEIATFFAEASRGGHTALYRVGEWTMDFEGKSFDGTAALPAEMKELEVEHCAGEVVKRLESRGIAPQTPCTPRGAAGYPPSMMPLPSGQCRLLDGTVILAAGSMDVMGDPIKTAIQLGEHKVEVDAAGIAAVRLNGKGGLDAVAAGGLNRFDGGGVSLALDTPTDLALWRDAAGNWQGVLHGGDGAPPSDLVRLTPNWTRVRLPETTPNSSRATPSPAE